MIEDRAEARLRALSTNIQRRLKDLRMSQSDVARDMGVSRALMSSWARGSAMPRKAALENLAKALQCQIPDLIPPKLLDSKLLIAGAPAVLDISYLINGQCSVKLNMTMPLHMAVEIAEIVKNLDKKAAGTADLPV